MALIVSMTSGSNHIQSLSIARFVDVLTSLQYRCNSLEQKYTSLSRLSRYRPLGWLGYASRLFLMDLWLSWNPNPIAWTTLPILKQIVLTGTSIFWQMCPACVFHVLFKCDCSSGDKESCPSTHAILRWKQSDTSRFFDAAVPVYKGV